jgi:hypothetical protein
MTRKSSSTPRRVATANIDRMVVDELPANLPFLDYGRVLRHPPEALHGAGTSSVRKTRASMQRSWELCAADIKALDQAFFDSKHVTNHLIR